MTDGSSAAVVTATDSDGRSYFVLDGEAGAVLEQPGRGLVFHELWVTEGPLASNEGIDDAAAGPVEHHPPPAGTRIRVVEFHPDDRHDAEAVQADFEAIDALHTLTDSDDPTMHRNDTVDYNIVLSGEIYACTDAGEILLRPGDVAIQRGTNHTWRNRGTETCVFASVMVSAEPLRPRESRLEQ